METLQDMRLFVRVVQAGSFSSAGRSVGLSPASVSRHINALEHALRVRLINRTSRKLALTEAGRVYFEKISRILRQLDELENEISEHQAEPRGLLNVHTRVSIGTQYLLPALPGFLSQYPGIKLKLLLTEEACDVIENKIDVAIRLGNLEEPSLAVRKLSSGAERVLFASPAYLDAHPPIRCPDDLVSHDCLTYLDGRLEDGCAAWRFRKSGIEKEIRVSGCLQVNNALVLRHAALAGHGIGLLPEWCVAEDLASGRLRRILPEFQASATTFDCSIYAVFQRAPHVPPKVRVFVDFLVRLFRSTPMTARIANPILPGAALTPGGALASLESSESHLGRPRMAAAGS